MGFPPKERYGLWVIVDLWVMGSNFPPTDLVDWKKYGIWEFMGYHRHGLWGVQLYMEMEIDVYENVVTGSYKDLMTWKSDGIYCYFHHQTTLVSITRQNISSNESIWKTVRLCQCRMIMIRLRSGKSLKRFTRQILATRGPPRRLLWPPASCISEV